MILINVFFIFIKTYSKTLGCESRGFFILYEEQKIKTEKVKNMRCISYFIYVGCKK